MTNRPATIKEQFNVLLQHISPPSDNNIGIPKPIRDQMERMFFMGVRVCYFSILDDMANKDPKDAEAHILDMDMEMNRYFDSIHEEVSVVSAIQAASKAVRGDGQEPVAP